MLNYEHSERKRLWFTTCIKFAFGLGEGDLVDLDDDPDAVEPDVIDQILERELQRNYSLEGSPERVTPKASPARRRLPLRSPKAEPGRRTLFSPSKPAKARSECWECLLVCLSLSSLSLSLSLSASLSQ